jgi:hypothetical protein
MPIDAIETVISMDCEQEMDASDERSQALSEHDGSQFFLPPPFVETYKEAMLRTRTLCAYARNTFKPLPYGLRG